MLKSINNNEALGIIFPNSYDGLVPELVTERLMASIPFASRYRLVDFIISGMARAGIDNISLIARENYQSLMDHLGSGREWDLARKNGGLNIIPPFAQKNVKVYNGRVEALESIKTFLVSQKEKYVVMADANFAANIDFHALLDAHSAPRPLPPAPPATPGWSPLRANLPLPTRACIWPVPSWPTPCWI